MTLYENVVKLRGFLGEAPRVETLGTKQAAILLLGIQSGTWKKQTNEWIPRTEWHRIVCFGGFFCGYAKTLRQGDYVEVDGELHVSEYDMPVVVEGERLTAKRSAYEVQATKVHKLEYPPIGVDEGDDG